MSSVPSPDQHAVILFAHGARDPQWAEPFRRIREQVSLQRPGVKVELAFLELMTPDLSQCVHELAQGGVRQMTLVPLFMAQGGHLKKDLPPMVSELENAHPGLRIHVTPAIGESAALLSAIASWVVQQSS
ncbi:MAG: CbiX/SirB N-terminal domain-containing protein [Betaproteobacteria bacterium]|nr:CbiX/SirB N-terminal domain-containing protein [Betaproteobacteria bacterium]MDE2132205.1 CbiX/SirB N-terminal domain-containing protein [Betaproteobacteria bacterium]MDE2212230.1 CbiX/SirB N-terminal domain-containing protein [Betaproteobacteria bacterium]